MSVQSSKSSAFKRRKDQPAECHYCGVYMPARTWTWDHIVPKSVGGTRAQYNLVPACVACNSKKAGEMPTCLCGICKKAVALWAILVAYPYVEAAEDIGYPQSFVNQLRQPPKRVGNK